MRCTTCNHLLWELRARQCPECGTSFRPSEHHFDAGGVIFCCPHCDQNYYGTGERGELVPRSFQCVGCRNHVDMDEMIMRPLDRSRPDEGMLRLPWDDRSARGWFRTVFSVMGLALVLPLRLGTMLCRREASGGGGYRFLLVVTLLVAVVAVLPMLIFVPFMFTGGGGTPQVPVFGIVSGMLGVMVVAMVVLPLLFVLVWGPVAHGLLILTGDVSGPLRRTFDALCFSGGALVASVVPCFGIYLGGPWWVVSAVMTLRNAQAVSTWRAIVAAMALPVLTVITIIGLYTWLIVWAMNTAAAVGATGRQMAVQRMQIDRLAERILAERVDGVLPGHLLHVAARGWTPITWMLDETSDASRTRRVAGESLEGFNDLPTFMRSSIADEAEAELIAPGAPHRVWDTVYLLPGANVDPAGALGDLWLVARSSAGISASWHVRQLNGASLEVLAEGQADALRAQNARREAAGLAPIPGPLQWIDERGDVEEVDDREGAAKPDDTAVRFAAPAPAGNRSLRRYAADRERHVASRSHARRLTVQARRAKC